jgi:phage terminase large subunit-like protein
MAITSNAQLMRALLGGHWSPYVPYNPSPKQLAFCALPMMEALGGGAAGGGKSAVLLMDALRYTDVPGYGAIIFRRSLTDLKRKGGLLDMAMQWLGPYIGSEIQYIPSIHQFNWWNGASLTFGYVGSYTAWEHYQGGNYQYIAWDELTQHSEQDYDEMFSRLRRNDCSVHGNHPKENCPNCELYKELRKVPLRVRGATNPGGRGHLWVKKRFKLYKDKGEKLINPVTKKPGIWLSGDPSKPFIPWFFIDNPGLDTDTYNKTLNMIRDDQRKAQLLEGDWDWVANGLFRPDWFQHRYRYQGGYYCILSPCGASVRSFHERKLRIFTVVDVACSVRTGVGERSFKQVQGGAMPASWTVIGTFGITPTNDLLVLDVRRFQEEAPQIFDGLRDVCSSWRPMYVCIEVNGPGKPIAQLALQMGVAVKEVIAYGDKISNSAEATVRCRQNKVLLPEEDKKPWTNDFMGELVTWTGHPHETDDQVDVLSNACHEFTRLSGNLDRQGVQILHRRDLPYISKKHGQIFNYPDGASLGY